MASGSFLVVAPAMLGVFFAFWLFTRKLSKISLNARVPRSHSSSSMSRSDVDEASDESLVRRMETGSYAPDALANLRKIYRDIQEGAQAFLAAEYRMCVVFLVGFGAPMAVLVSNGSHGFDGKVGFMTAFAFLAGGVTSMLSGYVG